MEKLFEHYGPHVLGLWQWSVYSPHKGTGMNTYCFFVIFSNQLLKKQEQQTIECLETAWHSPFVKGCKDYCMIPLTNGQQCRTRFHVICSSWSLTYRSSRWGGSRPIRFVSTWGHRPRPEPPDPLVAAQSGSGPGGHHSHRTVKDPAGKKKKSSCIITFRYSTTFGPRGLPIHNP